MDESKAGKTRRGKLDYPFEEQPQRGQTIDVAPGVKWISMDLPFAGLRWINLWLIEEDDGYALVDTGMNLKQTKQEWEALFEGPLKGKRLTRILITHMHPDHVGLAGWLCERFGIDMWMSRLEYVSCRMLVGDTGRAAPEDTVDFFRKAGWDDEVLDLLRKRYGSFGKGVYNLPSRFVRMSDGDVIRIGKQDWRVITGSGHSPEHSCLYNDELKLLISGDQLLPRISSNVSVHPTEPEADPLSDWLESCEKLIRETDPDVLTLPAHNKVFYGAHKRLQALIDGHERSLDRLEAHLEEPRRALDCFVSLFGRQVGAEDMYSATGEALAHLNWLRFKGRATRELRDGVYLYSRSS